MLKSSNLECMLHRNTGFPAGNPSIRSNLENPDLSDWTGTVRPIPMVGNDQIVPSGINGYVGGSGGYGLNTGCGLGGRRVVGFHQAGRERRGRVAVQGEGQRGRAIDNKYFWIASIC